LVNDEQTPVISFLSDPTSHGGAIPERVETHGAIVFLLPERVYKLKRAVRYSFMDFSTPEKRRAACLEEVRLNRRTAPDLYLGCRLILRTDTGLAFGEIDQFPDGTVETVVEMRRFENTLADNAANDAELRQVAQIVAAFHEAEPPLIDAGGSASMRAVLDGNLADLAADVACNPDGLAALIDLACSTLAARAGSIDDRRAAGAVRHCHGDLHLGNICRWQGQPILFDCIEFNPDFARIDTLYDLAFLLMDLDARGRRDAACLVLNRYLEHRVQEVGALDLLPLFLSMRAQIRAKVTYAAASLDQTGKAAEQRRQAGAYLQSAIDYLSPPKPVLIAIGGPSGSGKSTVARALSAHIGAAPGAVIARSDAIRKRLHGAREETERLPAEAYSTEAHQATYGEMERICAAALSQGHGAIADATFTNVGSRDRIQEIAQAVGVPFVGIWLDLDETTARDRVAARRGDASDATVDIVTRQFANGWGKINWNRIPATLPLDAQIGFCLKASGNRPAEAQ